MNFGQMRVFTLFLCLLFPLIELWSEPDTSYEQAAWFPGLLARLDYRYPGMEQVQEAYESGDYKKAAGLLDDYYQARETDKSLLPLPLSEHQYDILEPDRGLAGEFKLQDIWGAQEKKHSGAYDWQYKGPQNDQEWAWFFNRHRILRIWYASWLRTQNPEYSDAIEVLLKDWIQDNPAPAYLSLSSTWRALEAARRIDGPWLEIFFRLHGDMALSQELRLMMLNSVWEHGHYLREHHAFFGNHLITEMSCLLASGCSCAI